MTTRADDFVLPLRDDLVGEVPYGAPQIDVPHLMNVNENPYGPSAELARHMGEHVAKVARGLNRYPDREFHSLRERLGQFVAYEAQSNGGLPEPPFAALPAVQVWAANGSNEIMHQILTAFGGPGRTALGFTPHYSMYPEYARNTLTSWVTVPRGGEPDFSLFARDILAAVDHHDPTLVLLTSPNNPTGTALDALIVADIAAALESRGALLVVDEAYAEFRRPGVPTAVGLVNDHPNLIVTRTMSKAFALAGARVGYMAAQKPIIDAMRIVRLPYHLSAVSQAVAHAALDFTDELLGSVDELRDSREALRSELEGGGFTVADSDSNFLLFGPVTDRHAVFQALLDRGVLIREVGPEGWLRVSVGNRDNNRAFIDAIEEVTRS